MPICVAGSDSTPGAGRETDFLAAMVGPVFGGLDAVPPA